MDGFYKFSYVSSGVLGYGGGEVVRIKYSGAHFTESNCVRQVIYIYQGKVVQVEFRSRPSAGSPGKVSRNLHQKRHMNHQEQVVNFGQKVVLKDLLVVDRCHLYKGTSCH